jgi:hypothetical protein
MVEIRWVAVENEESTPDVRDPVERAYGQERTGWVELTPGVGCIQVLGAVGRRWGGDELGRWVFEDMRFAVQQSLQAAGVAVCHRVEQSAHDSPAPDGTRPEQERGFEMSEPTPVARRERVDPLPCFACGGTGVVSKTRYPDAPPAPGYIESMGRCPVCRTLE